MLHGKIHRAYDGPKAKGSLLRSFGADQVRDSRLSFGKLWPPRRHGRGVVLTATTILFDELLKDNAKELIEKAIEMAKGGDGPALRLCIERLAPARKDRPVWFDLPEMKEAKDAVSASAAIVAGVASGELTPMEASELGKLIEFMPAPCRPSNLRNVCRS